VLNVAWRWEVAGVEAGRGKPRPYAENLWSAFSSISASARQRKRVSAGVTGFVRGTKKDTRAPFVMVARSRTRLRRAQKRPLWKAAATS
jgi:hypothetical protein